MQRGLPTSAAPCALGKVDTWCQWREGSGVEAVASLGISFEDKTPAGLFVKRFFGTSSMGRFVVVQETL